MSEVVYNISKHAEERYAERILNIKDKNEISRYIANNKDKINTDIHKMIKYGNNIYNGRNTYKAKFGNTNNISLFISNAWVVLTDPDKLTVITLFKKDLGVDDEEFNKLYVEKLFGKFNELQLELARVQGEVEVENSEMRKQIEINNAKITDYRETIKLLEGANSGLRLLIDANFIKVKEQEEKLSNLMEKIMTK